MLSDAKGLLQHYLPLTGLGIGSIARDDIAYQSRGDNRRSLTTELMFLRRTTIENRKESP